MNEKLRKIEKVEALFRQAESTTIEEERLTFMAKAQELLTKWSLSEYDLQLAGQARVDDHIETVAIEVNDPHCDRKSTLLSQVARANGIKVVRGFRRSRNEEVRDADGRYVLTDKGRIAKRRNDGPIDAGYGLGMSRTVSTDKPSVNYRLMYLTGYSKDIESTTLIYTSLLIQAKSEIGRAQINSWENRTTWISHFYLGFASEVGRRLQAGSAASVTEVRQAAAAQGVDLLPVLVERSKRVEESYDEVWGGNLSNGRSSHVRTTTSGYSAGRAAGARSNVGSRSIGGVGAIGTGR